MVDFNVAAGIAAGMLDFSVTKRSARVRLENQTGKRILSVAVVHKYSDNYVNTKDDWGEIEPGATTNPDMTVEYHTGDTTTGKDWWSVTWSDEFGELFVTSPNNYRGVIDFLESLAHKGGPPLAVGSIIGMATGKMPLKYGIPLAATGAVAAVASNDESTVGFKQHILREEDQNEPTTIILRGDTVVFSSKSGTSETVTSSGGKFEANPHLFWRLEDRGDGFVSISPKVNPGAFLDANNGERDAKPYFNTTHSPTENDNLLWKLEDRGEGFVSIASKKNLGSFLDARGGEPGKFPYFNNIHSPNENSHQRWRCIDQGDGFVSFSPQVNNTFLDANNGVRDNNPYCNDTLRI